MKHYSPITPFCYRPWRTLLEASVVILFFTMIVGIYIFTISQANIKHHLFELLAGIFEIIFLVIIGEVGFNECIRQLCITDEGLEILQGRNRRWVAFSQILYANFVEDDDGTDHGRAFAIFDAKTVYCVPIETPEAEAAFEEVRRKVQHFESNSLEHEVRRREAWLPVSSGQTQFNRCLFPRLGPLAARTTVWQPVLPLIPILVTVGLSSLAVRWSPAIQMALAGVVAGLCIVLFGASRYLHTHIFQSLRNGLKQDCFETVLCLAKGGTDPSLVALCRWLLPIYLWYLQKEGWSQSCETRIRRQIYSLLFLRIRDRWLIQSILHFAMTTQDPLALKYLENFKKLPSFKLYTHSFKETIEKYMDALQQSHTAHELLRASCESSMRIDSLPHIVSESEQRE
jgi:hypothetical protein